MVKIYPGAMHIHTTYSDGTGTIGEIADSAKKTGLKWIIITDHNSLKGLKNNEEGWYDGVAVIIGNEISPEKSDHYLVLGTKEEITSMEPEIFIKEVRNQGGIGFVAHPDESISMENKYPPLRWTDWNIKDFDGIEIWNYMSDWVDHFNNKRILRCLLKRNDVLTGPTPETLKWWDNLNNNDEKIIPAVGGVDVHAFNYKLFCLNYKIFSYYDSFKTVTNHIILDEELSDNFETAKNQIQKALHEGRNIIINRCWGAEENNPVFYFKNKEKRVYTGGITELKDDSALVIELAKKSLIKLSCNGKIVHQKHSKELVYKDIVPGKYRAEVHYREKPWIFTNPILVK